MADKTIKEPHPHDVLSGRGNFVNYHDGNEYFRKLVRKHKLEYVNCPKQQKGKFSKMIVDEIKARKPPGRFLKQDKETKLWYDIGEKKALDKTRQALREGAPDLMNNGKSSSKDDLGGDTTYNKPSVEEQHHSISEMSILQRSLMSLGSESFNHSSGMINAYNLQGMGLSPNMIQSAMYAAGANNNNSNNNSNRNIADLSRVIPPPQLHQNDSTLLQEQQHQRKEQEIKQQLRRLQIAEQQRLLLEEQQQRQNQFTSQQAQKIIEDATAAATAAATAVITNDFQNKQNQLRLRKLKEKRLYLEQEILRQQKIEMAGRQKVGSQQNQQRVQDYQHQSDQNQTSADMRGALQSRLGAIYGNNFLEPTPIPGQDPTLPPSRTNGGSSSFGDVTGELAGNPQENSNNSAPPRDRRAGLQRENSLKLDDMFDKRGGSSDQARSNNPKKNLNASTSGMSMSATSLSLGFDEEGELSALFDTSIRLEGRGYATGLNDNPPRSPRAGALKTRGNSAGASGMGGSTNNFNMSLASFGGKSNSSMSCDSSLSRLFDDTERPSK